MLKNIKLQTGSRIAHFIGQALVLIVCCYCINFTWQTNILPDKYAQANYVQTNAYLISKQLKSAGYLVDKYRADFLISYNVDGVQYNRWVTGNGLDLLYSQNKRQQEAILARYNTGGTYPCWYDPHHPSHAILIARHDWLSILPLLLPLVAGLIAVFFVMKEILNLIGALTVKTFDLAAWDALE